MTSVKRFKNWIFLVVAVISGALVVLVFLLMGYVQQLLYSDVRINLTEVVSQNRDVITSKLMLEVNNLDLLGKQLLDKLSNADDADTAKREAFFAFADEIGDDRICWSSAEGIALFPDGQEINISGRRYFQRAMEGVQNISDRTVSRRDGKDIFVISVPMYSGSQIVGSVQKQYTPEEMYALCSISLFSQQGYMYIINSDGYILINSQSGVYNRESDNYYHMAYLENPEASKRLETDIRNEKSGFTEMVIEGKRMFSAYTPIDQIDDWFLISSVATNAVSPNASVVILLFYIILLTVVIFFTLIMLYLLHQKHKQHLRLEHVAFVDTVTGGDTYTKFTVDLQEILRRNPAKQFYIYTFDIDNFKYINNFYGFDFGDHILKQLYTNYSAKLSADERLARVYSDHFVALLENADNERLKGELFSSNLILDNISVYFSAGLYPIGNPKENVNLMMDKANMAAQKIKGIQDKHVAVYSEELDQEVIRNEHVKRAVEQALKEKEIIPYYQPKVDINTRKLVGAEALARWRTKEGALVPPSEFIPVCEKSGLIEQVDMAIFEQTLQFLRSNLDAGIKCVPISVNFSRQHLYNKDFLSNLLNLLSAYKIPPDLVELELTETAIFDSSQQIEEFIQQLHQHGLHISMDDFGSGYSSLNMLKDVDIDTLKIDQGFLKDTTESKRQKVIFSVIAQMAEQLNIRVVVEGVETPENVALMQEFNCSVAQGYYFARPLAEPDFETIYREGRLPKER